jgi:peptide-methionine (R)-S-oxide reductase
MSDKTMTDKPGHKTIDKVVKTDAEWRAQLTPEQYKVARQHGTERAFSGIYADHHEDGVYTCVGCGTPMFDSATKFESGTGWPSFWQPADPALVEAKTDRSFFMTRTEVHCSNCGGHLGHVFPDGPKPTGERYCMNGAAMDFKSD